MKIFRRFKDRIFAWLDGGRSVCWHEDGGICRSLTRREALKVYSVLFGIPIVVDLALIYLWYFS